MSEVVFETNQAAFTQISRIMGIFRSSLGTIRPNFFLTGPSGAGKSHLIQYLCQAKEIPLLEINAAQLTKEGTAGNSLSKALAPLMQHSNRLTVVLVDEFDKLFISGNNNNELAHEVTHGVQNEFLKVLEGTTTAVFGDWGKYHNIPTHNLLFIFAGAFNNEENMTLDRLREFNIKTEFLGRVGLLVSLKQMSQKEFEVILNKSELLASYLELFSKTAEKKKIVNEIMQAVIENFEKNTLGVRMLNTLIHQYFINGSLKKQEVKKVTFQKTLKL